MNENVIKQQICGIGKRMYDSGFVAANDGNITVKLNGRELITTPAGVSKGFMTPEMMIKVDLAGNVIMSHSDWQPSSELKMHLQVYQDRPDVGAVVHAHPPYATTFAIAHMPLNKPLIAEAIVALGCVPVAGYGTPSTQEIPEAVAPYLKKFDAVLLANHGALAWGADLITAYHKLESVEFYAKLTFLSMQLGCSQELTAGQIKKLYALKKQPANICGVECPLQCSRNNIKKQDEM
ncbi:class II aldolase/adducin family protein [Sporomusa termitida]|uniref:Methylthioribulose-1-phosphate dehydratase n=1 Tax=Sporomusa termitida TaxID=2377 RepID=A0A517DRS5_9FIRM|nr:class II aldolase/adducin family protein [Sporomusa termitida]QDR80017.1 Methylthioribulose-1-phosphate dehydratase [Sporomusa termitida]